MVRRITSGNIGGPGQLAGFTGTIVSGSLGWGPDQNNAGPIGIENIRDGTSNTALFSERLVGLNNVSPRRHSIRSNIDFKRVVFTGPSVGGGQDAGPAAALTVHPGLSEYAWHHASRMQPGAVVLTGLAGYPLHVVINDYLHAGTPNGPACNNPQGSFASLSWIYFVNPSGSAPPTSNHPGGVNLALADGSVKFVKDSIGLQPWWALGTRASGEVLSSDQY